MKKKRLFIMIIAIVVGVIIILFLYIRNKYRDLCAYTEKVFEIEWNGCIESAAGDVTLDWGEEEYAYIKLKVRVGSEEEVLSIVQGRFGKPLDLSQDRAVLNEQHEFKAELENSDIQYVYENFMKGKRAHTRYTRFYIVYDENKQMYIYVMG